MPYCKYSVVKYGVADTPDLRVFAIVVSLLNHVLVRLALFLDELDHLSCTRVVKAALEKDTVFRQIVLVKSPQFFVEEVVLHNEFVILDIATRKVCLKTRLP